jgi:23S rRNA U2552 (ribose-2'-O)-methylase RlmE/FtsJ
MIYFLLPSSPKYIFQRISITQSNEEPTVAVSHSLCKYMNEIKEKIATRDKEWDIYKKYTNPYEYIHSIVPHKKRAVSKYKPISRSYFKMIEMIATFQLDKCCCENQTYLLKSMQKSASFSQDPIASIRMKPDDYDSLSYKNKSSSLLRSGLASANASIKRSKSETFDAIVPRYELLVANENDALITMPPPPMRTFHLAEGPGGFIEAICNKRANVADQYYGMTILVDEMDDNVPAWNKSGGFLAKHPNVRIETGADGTGNLLHIQNFDYCVAKYGSTMDLVTADGGFDFSKDFNKQEISILHLLWGQVCYALCLQKRGGNFVLKIFDIFYEHTIDILYILSGFYEAVNVCKLQTSRIGNSEKYVVCKGFRFNSNADFLSIIRESFEQIELTALSRLRCDSAIGSNNFRRSGILGTIDAQALVGDRVGNSGILRTIDAQALIGDRVGNSGILGTIDAQALIGDRVGMWTINTLFVRKILNCSIPRYFTKHIEDINAMIGQQQIENIHYTISLIDKNSKCEKMDNLTRQNIIKCAQWCVEHNVPYHNLTTTNSFVDFSSPFASLNSSCSKELFEFPAQREHVEEYAKYSGLEEGGI